MKQTGGYGYGNTVDGKKEKNERNIIFTGTHFLAFTLVLLLGGFLEKK